MDILLVEDSPGDVRLAQLAFGKSERPVNLHVASDGVEAMAFLRKEGPNIGAPRPQLILLDLNLPRMDGRELLALIKKDEDLRAIPTIVLTASDSEEDILYCYRHHANCYIRKPEQWDAFDRVVRHVNEFWLTKAKLPAQRAG